MLTVLIPFLLFGVFVFICLLLAALFYTAGREAEAADKAQRELFVELYISEIDPNRAYQRHRARLALLARSGIRAIIDGDLADDITRLDTIELKKVS